jgi:hypothetical protein
VRNAEFEGGPKSFMQFLRERLGRFKSSELVLFITLEGTLSEDGILFSLRPLPYLQNRPPEERELAKQMIAELRDMPRWQPMIVDDEPVQTDLLISIQLSAGKVQTASYGLNLF